MVLELLVTMGFLEKTKTKNLRLKSAEVEMEIYNDHQKNISKELFYKLMAFMLFLYYTTAGKDKTAVVLGTVTKNPVLFFKRMPY